MSEWPWEYDPDEAHVIGDENRPPPAFVAEVEEQAWELARAAEASLARKHRAVSKQ
ncbi:hypothetical protein [Streptomyces sp. NPDC059909]|uniref:hypothetical protein n=1 Tax=Streptomyces sp. NPDC059909 TaxID=3346998 RepID=UPI00365456B5